MTTVFHSQKVKAAVSGIVPPPPSNASSTPFAGLGNSLAHTVAAACDWLIGEQKADGHWV
ncbi:hypothetical protein JK182_15120, partial [Acetobacter okinawensis]|nr:hypothetical protein [Acetobacter okinawensis]